MNLPKNVTQIGETNHNCKIYVEDYVISYIKQLNRHAMDKGMAVGLYGVRKEEAGITYLFFYGAGKLNFLQREARHLSQAVLQEAEKMRKRYFGEYVFLGYCLLDGEMVEGFHVYEQGVCRYLKGYAQFYEKNDSMLRFMLEERQEEVKPEEFDQEKYDAVKRRQEERRSMAEERERSSRTIHQRSGRDGKPVELRLRRMQMTAAAVFVLLCAAGLASMDGGERLGELRAVVGDMLAGISERQLPDAVEVSTGTVQVGTIVAEDKLTEAIRRENEAAGEGGSDVPSESVPSPADGTTQSSQDGEGFGPQSSQGGEGFGSQSSQGGEGFGPQSSQGGEGFGPQSSQGGEGFGPQSSQGGEDFGPQPSQGGEGFGPQSSQGGEDSGSQPSQNEEASGTGEPPASESAPEPVSYTVRRGDTLIGICLARYGSDARVAEICSLNNIENPDDIKVGEKILLPQ